MARGDVSPSEKREFEQPETGARVLQLTDHPCSNVTAYYNHEQFVNGSERLVARIDRACASSTASSSTADRSCSSPTLPMGWAVGR